MLLTIDIPIGLRADMQKGMSTERLVLAEASYADFVHDRIFLPPVVQVCIFPVSLYAHSYLVVLTFLGVCSLSRLFTKVGCCLTAAFPTSWRVPPK